MKIIKGNVWQLLSLTLLMTIVSVDVYSKEIPIEHFAMRAVIDDVELSPDGKYLSMMRTPTKDGDPIIEIYNAEKLDEKPFRMNADPMEITSHDWVSNTEIVFSIRQKVRDRIEGFNEGVYETRIALLNVPKQKLKYFDDRNVSIANLLPDNPNRIIISFNEGIDGSGQRLAEAFRPLAYYEFDLKRGSKKLLIRGKISLANIVFDRDGHPWLGRGFDSKREEFVWYYRGKKDKDWQEFHRQDINSFETFSVQGLDTAASDHVLVSANNGNDKVGLWSFDVRNKKFKELIYRRQDVDVAGVRFHSNFWGKRTDEVVAVRYDKDKYHWKYFDGEEEAIYKQLAGLISSPGLISIESRTRDGSEMVVRNISDRDPGTYYLLKGGNFQIVGSRQPLIKSEDLAKVEYITYKSRDGRKIPGFITIPNAKPPYPLVVMPHGGPFVGETVVYSEWAQFLASRGYLVLQPQYRGSLGYGMDHYLSAFIDGGQGGFKMQDDKDDGALHLVKEGLADPDRLAMFGWSYGGYAALVAASRQEQIYQCVIAGAAVSDTNMQVNYYRYSMRGAQEQEQTRMWDDSISPIEETEKVNVPMLLIHGNVDQRVPPAHANKYRKLLEKHDKNFEYLELEGADHFSNTLFYDHQYDMYTAIEDYLENKCGEGGL